MSDTLEYIEDYFEKKLGDAEKQAFEQRCTQDEAFANDVALYITTREAIRLKLLEEKKELWSNDIYNEGNGTTNNGTPVRKLTASKWLSYAAAACLVLALGLYFMYRPQTPHQLASNYATKTLSHLSPSMDASRDSLQKGIALYNRGAYDTALLLFQSVYQADSTINQAKEYMGLAYLMKKDYDQALLQFDELSKKEIKNNSGVFYKAITLLERDGNGDRDSAKKLLEQVKANPQLEGQEKATEWLQKW